MDDHWLEGDDDASTNLHYLKDFGKLILLNEKSVHDTHKDFRQF